MARIGAGQNRWGDAWSSRPEPHGGHERLGAVGGAELLVDVRDVGLGGRLAHVEPTGDLAGAEAVGQQRQHLVLARGQPRHGRRRRTAHHGRAQAGAQEGARRHRGVLGGADHVGRTAVLADERRGARLHGREDVVVAGVHREHDDARVSLISARSARTMSSPVPSGSWRSVTTTSGRDVAEDVQPVADGAGLSDDGHLVVALEGAGESLADQLVVIDQHDGGGHCRSPWWWSLFV